MSHELHDREFENVPDKAFHDGPALVEILPTSHLAIASLVFGILAYTALPVFGALVAIVTGQMAMGQIQGAGGRIGGRPLAKTGLVLGYIQAGLVSLVLAVMACLMLISMVRASRMETPATLTVETKVATPTFIEGAAQAGVKMVNEMERSDFRLVADAGVDADPAEIVAFYNAGRPLENPEFALVTTKAVTYLKDGSKTSFGLKEVSDIKDDASCDKAYHTRNDPRNGNTWPGYDPDVYQVEVASKAGTRMRIKIRPARDGQSFYDGLRSAWEAAGGTPRK